MSYQILSKNDLSSGATLVVRIPESELDKKALYTMLADTPGFVLPFRHKNVDGDIELTYMIGARNKLHYSYGSRNPKEYAALWTSIITPLLECNNWFMNPFSFVMQTEYLYYDKADGTVSYVYIPSVCECSDANALNRMASELAEKCPADNQELEIKALRAIMQGFNPRGFLQMLKDFQMPAVRQAIAPPAPRPAHAPTGEAGPPEQPGAIRQPLQAAAPQSPLPDDGAPVDIVIDLDSGKGWKEGSGKKAEKPEKAEKAEKAKSRAKGGGIFGGKADNKQAAQRPGEHKKPKSGGLFGKKDVEQQPVIMDTSAGRRKAHQPKDPHREYPAPAAPYAPQHTGATDEMTQLLFSDEMRAEGLGAKFRLVGRSSLPPEIPVNVGQDKPFTIGRFDINVGRKQCDFEFGKSTKAVSRRHAAVERNGDAYTIVDLSSSAGTFVNGQRLTPNVPQELTFGARVSFGTSGADYVFEG